eukprot:1168870-Amphidinium_carterae.1
MLSAETSMRQSTMCQLATTLCVRLAAALHPNNFPSDQNLRKSGTAKTAHLRSMAQSPGTSGIKLN